MTMILFARSLVILTAVTTINGQWNIFEQRDFGERFRGGRIEEPGFHFHPGFKDGGFHGDRSFHGNEGQTWVVIVAGAKGYVNYFSQSQTCNIYLTLTRKRNIPHQQVILLSYGDVAHSAENPIEHDLVVKPGGQNVHLGCRPDYSGIDVTPEVFLKVIQGDSQGLRQLLGREGPVVNGGPKDRIFVYMSGFSHNGVFFFPKWQALGFHSLVPTLVNMHRAKRFSQMLIALDASGSGTMFQGILPPDIGVYVIACSKNNSPCFAQDYDASRKVYLGSVFGNAWRFNDLIGEDKTVGDQVKSISGFNNLSRPCEYGDLRVRNSLLTSFMGRMTSYFENDARLDLEPVESAGIVESPSTSSDLNKLNLKNPPLHKIFKSTILKQLEENKDHDSKVMKDLMKKLSRLSVINKAAGKLIKDITNCTKVAEKLEGKRDLKGKQLLLEKMRINKCYVISLEFLVFRCPKLNHDSFPELVQKYDNLLQLCSLYDYMDVLDGIVRASERNKVLCTLDSRW